VSRREVEYTSTALANELLDYIFALAHAAKVKPKQVAKFVVNSDKLREFAASFREEINKMENPEPKVAKPKTKKTAKKKESTKKKAKNKD
jgi:hypothetical protein